MNRYIRLAGALVAAMFASAAPAATIVYTTTLTSAAENNPNNTSPGTGMATVTVDFDLRTMHVDANFSGMQGQSNAAHIHCCSLPSASAGIAVGSPILPGFPLGFTAGTYSHDIDLTQASSFSTTFITANGGTVDSAFSALTTGLNAGQAYLNIHSNLFSAGEIRGHLAPAVPLPSALLMLLTGMAGVAARARRRRPK